MSIDDFKTTPFPFDESIVYVLFFRARSEDQFKPFYVGESSRGFRRIGEYVSKQFSAPTDFIVGTVVQELKNRKCEVIVKYKFSDNRKCLEKQLIKLFTDDGHTLLNGRIGYNYKTASKLEIESRLIQLTNELIQYF